jgi:hypothetical protein
VEGGTACSRSKYFSASGHIAAFADLDRLDSRKVDRHSCGRSRVTVERLTAKDDVAVVVMAHRPYTLRQPPCWSPASLILTGQPQDSCSTTE